MLGRNRSGRTTTEWLLIGGTITIFFWPFVQLWSIKAIPFLASDSHKKAAVAVENLLAEALARPFLETLPKTSFKPLPGGSEIGLEGKIEILPHPDISGLTIVRAHVRWGVFFFRKFLSLEAVVSQTRA